MSRRRSPAAAAVVTGALLLAACASSDEPSAEPVDIFGGLRGVDADLFVESLRGAPSLEAIDIDYVGSQDFVDDLIARTENDGDPPDIALVPQPGVIAELVEQGLVVDLDDETLAAIDEHLTAQSKALGQLDGRQVAVPYRLTTKSLVWYRPQQFADEGWAVPTSLDELSALVEEIGSVEGRFPWCFSVQSGAATGWPATDWIEDLLLRLAGPEIYDGWVAGDVESQSEAVTASMQEFQRLVLDRGRTDEGTRGILTTLVEDSAHRFATGAPCVLYKQADLALDWFPDGTEIGPDGDVDFFVLPADSEPAPILVGGFLAVAFDDRPEVDAVMRALASPEGSAAWREEGTFVGPIGVESGPTAERLTSLLADGRTLHFDGSDSMPAPIGTSVFWGEVTRWISGAATLDQMTANLDAAFAERD